jgi:pimeloyl-ACP methyl ester carboxylesterase
MGFVERQIDAGAVTLNFAEGPAIGKPLVVLHGATSRWQDMMPILNLLAEHWHVYALDLRGHGNSGRAAGHYRLTDYAQDVAAFIRQEIGEATIVYGHSLGGIVAMNMAAHSPSVVRALVLEDPALVEYTHRPEEIFAHPYFQGTYKLLQKDRSVEGILAWLKATSPPDTPLDALIRRAQTLSVLDPEMLVPILQGNLSQKGSLADAVRQITCPVLLLQADPAIGAATEDQHVDVIREHLPQAKIAQIKGASHGIHDSQLEALLVQVMAFLEGLERE